MKLLLGLAALAMGVPISHNRTLIGENRSLLENHTRALLSRNLTAINESVINHTGRVLTQNESIGRTLFVGADRATKELLLLKGTPRVDNVSISNMTNKFWEDVKVWAVGPQPECTELLNKYFDPYTVVVTGGLPVSFAMLGSHAALCKLMKDIVILKSLEWKNEFFNDLTSSAMGKLTVTGEAMDKAVKLPANLEFTYFIQFDPLTSKLAKLEVVPVEPDAIYDAVASKPIKSFHHLVNVALKKGIKSPQFQSLLSDKFELEAPNIFVGPEGLKTRFTKTEFQEFVDQNIKPFDFSEAKLAEYSIPFHDDKSVVSEIVFDELPLKANGFKLEGVKFWVTHTFDCEEEIKVPKDNVPGNAMNTPKIEAFDTIINRKPIMPERRKDRGCVLTKMRMIVNRPISLLTKLIPLDLELDEVLQKV